MINVQSELIKTTQDSKNNISYNENTLKNITFKKYKRTTLPLDGYIFWVSTGETISVTGNFYIDSGIKQLISENYDSGHIRFICNTEIKSFYDKDVSFIWVGEALNTKFVIGSQLSRDNDNGLFHYYGKVLRPIFENHFIDDFTELDVKETIVSNSLPFFLSLPLDKSPALTWCSWPEHVPIFPSYCVPENQSPPYIVVHNDPDTIIDTSLSMVDNYTASDSQIVKETVSLLLYGMTNKEVSNIRNFILHWALLNPEKFGVINNPFIRDEKEIMPEAGILAMYKKINFEIMYCQTAARNQALQLIKSAKITLRNS